MAQISSYTPLTTPAANDLLVVVDVSDTTMSPAGTTKAVQVQNLVDFVPGTANYSASASAGGILSVTNTHSAPTGPSVQLTAAAAGDRVLGVEVTGDTSNRFVSDSNGALGWGNGSLRDTAMQRASGGGLTVTFPDGNTYDVARLLLEAPGSQTVNATGYNPVTGWGGIHLGTGTYHVRGKVQVTPGGAAGGVLMEFTGSGGLAVSTLSVDFIEVALPSGGGAASFGNANRIVALASAFSGATFGTSNREVGYDGTVVVTTAGTFTPQVACQTSGSDTWAVKAGSYIEILPVIA